MIEPILHFRTQKTTLFRFESSLHSIGLNDSNAERENQDKFGNLDNGTDRVLIVEPNARLVIEIYQPLMTFVQEIEIALGCNTQGFVFRQQDLLQFLKEFSGK